MFSLSSPKPLSLSSSTTNSFLSPFSIPSLSFFTPTKIPTSTTTITSSSLNSNTPPFVSNLIIPKSSSPSPVPQNLYQPYRPPQAPPRQKYRNLDTASIIEVLSNRLGLWFEYAPLISTLFRDGFTPPSIEELTGISGVEQNRLVVGAQVRESIAESPDIDPQVLAFFDNGGSEILYEFRLLSASQRAAAATYVVNNRLDGAKAREIARAIKDFPSRQLVPNWSKFDYSKPGDCWAFTFFRQSKDLPKSSEKWSAALKMALEVVETEEAKAAVIEEMEGPKAKDEKPTKDDGVRVPVVRLQMGEVAEATSVVVLPVCKAEEREDGLSRAPFQCRTEGEFGAVVSEKGWNCWVVLPKWLPIAGMGPGGVAVTFPDDRVLPWRVNSSHKEPLLVVADRSRTDVRADDGFYLVVEDGGQGKLKIGRGSTLKEKGVNQSLGTVIIVVRSPRDEYDDQLSDEDWE